MTNAAKKKTYAVHHIMSAYVCNEELFGTDKERALARRNELSDLNQRVRFVTKLPSGNTVITEGMRMWKVRANG